MNRTLILPLFDPTEANKFFHSVSRIRTVIFDPATQVALFIAALCLILQFTGMSDTLRFDRGAIETGNWWLLLSGNFVHFGLSHLLLNLAGLVLIYSLVWRNFNAMEWLAIILISSLGVGLGLYHWDLSIFWYVGFSGTLHGLIIAGTLADFRRFPGQAALLLLVIIGKLAFEQIYGALPGSADVAGGAVAVNSHLFGAISGAIIGLALLLWKMGRERRTQTPP
ncbi:MAG: rhombosortase [Gammaproteobacteria bacterium]|nr:rhombosortase [Gammaproteobacteria bacterium]